MLHTPIQSVIQTDLLSGASLDMPPDEQFEFIDYLLAAHCGFADFYLPDQPIPLVPPVSAQQTMVALNDSRR